MGLIFEEFDPKIQDSNIHKKIFLMDHHFSSKL